MEMHVTLFKFVFVKKLETMFHLILHSNALLRAGIYHKIIVPVTGPNITSLRGIGNFGNFSSDF